MTVMYLHVTKPEQAVIPHRVTGVKLMMHRCGMHSILPKTLFAEFVFRWVGLDQFLVATCKIAS